MVHRRLSAAMLVLWLISIAASSQPSSSLDFDMPLDVFADLKVDGSDNDMVDFGFFIPNGTIGDLVWHDKNGNGIQDGDENGLANVKISIYNKITGEFVNSTVSNQTGYYIFEIPYGSYKVIAGETQKIPDDEEGCIRLPADPCDWCPTKIGIGDPKNDSNYHNYCSVVLEEDDRKNTTIDFGYVRSC